MNIPQMVDNTTHIPKERLVANPSFPDSIKIEVTSRCNLKCEYCASKNTLRSIGDIDKDFLFKILRDVKKIGVTQVGLFLLGEPFLVDELPLYIKYAKDIGIEYVYITTNGVLCNPSILQKVCDAGLDSLKFSVNTERDRYNKVHGLDAFDIIMKNIKWLHNYSGKKPITCASYLHSEEHKSELEDLKEELMKYVDDVYSLPMYNQAGLVEGSVVGNIGRFENMVSPVPCWGLFNAAKVTWDGWLTACCFDHAERFKIADLKVIDIVDAWNDPKFVELRKRHLDNNLKNSICSKCQGL